MSSMRDKTSGAHNSTVRKRAAFDLDGTLYDSKGIIVRLLNEIFQGKGYQPTTPTALARAYTGYMELYQNLGIKQEDVPEIIESYRTKIRSAELPELVPGAKQALELTERRLGRENLYIVTYESPQSVERRFQKDGLLPYLPNVRSASPARADKAEVLFALTAEKSKAPLIYVADTVSDGKDCLKARERGADVMFCGVLHEYAMNEPEAIRRFATENGFSTINSLDEIYKIL